MSSNYAKTAAVESMVTRGYLTQNGMCANDPKLMMATGHMQQIVSTAAFEASRGVQGMFAECAAPPRGSATHGAAAATGGGSG